MARRSMNVMEIVSGAAVNGAVVHCLLLSRELARRGHRVTLVCRPGAWIGEQAGGEIEVVRSDLHRWPPDELRRIAALALEKRIDLLHTHMSRAHFFGVLLRWLSGVPCVATAHNRYFQLHWMLNDRVIAVSEDVRRFQRRWNFVSARRIEVIHNFIDSGRFAHSAKSRDRVRSELAIHASAPLVGVVGSIVPRKGQVYLVRALPKILAEVPETRILLVGDGSPADRARIEREALELGVASRVLWAGFRSDVPEVLAALDLFVLPSIEEPLPLSLLEAMAAGLPVVATTAGGMREVVGSDEAGLLVPPRDCEALARAVIRLAQDADLRRRLGAAGRARVERSFSPERQVPLVEAAFARAALGARGF